MSARKGPSDNNVNQGIVDFLMGKQYALQVYVRYRTVTN